MIFVGFGFLMTFLKHYSYSALGLNFFCSCIVMLEALLVIGAVQQVIQSLQCTKALHSGNRKSTIRSTFHHCNVCATCGADVGARAQEDLVGPTADD